MITIKRMIENVSVHLGVSTCKLCFCILTDIYFFSNFYPVGWRENDGVECWMIQTGNTKSQQTKQWWGVTFKEHRY